MARWLVKHYFWVLSVRVFLEKISIWFSRQSKMWVSHSIWWGPKWKKMQRQGEFPFSLFAWAGSSIFSCPWTMKLLILGPLRLWDLHTWPPGCQAFRFRLTYTTRFPSSSTHRWQTVGLLGFYNHVSQSYSLLLYIPISYWFSFSIQPRQIQHSTKPNIHYLLKNTQQYGRDLLFVGHLYKLSWFLLH